MTTEEKIIELEKNRDTVKKRLNVTTDQFFVYGLVKQIKEIDNEIAELKKN